MGYNHKKLSEKNSMKTCNTDKSKNFSWDMKCKTRGIQLACANCDIIYRFRELFGAESCTQVAQMYIDLCEAFNGMFIIRINFKSITQLLLKY